MFVHDDGSKNVVEKIRDHVGKSCIVYLAIPPNSYLSAIRKYKPIAAMFALEKPWASSVRDFQSIRKLAKNKVIGVDHYLWKPEVRGFLAVHADKPYDTLVVLCEDSLPAAKRQHFWTCGIISDMLPHAISLLMAAFPAAKVQVVKATGRSCANKKAAKARQLYNKSLETFARIDLAHADILLGMGVQVKPITYNGKKITTSKFFQTGPHLVDMSNSRYYINGKMFKASGDEYRDILAALLSRKFDMFISAQEMGQRIGIIEKVKRMKKMGSDYRLGADAFLLAKE